MHILVSGKGSLQFKTLEIMNTPTVHFAVHPTGKAQEPNIVRCQCGFSKLLSNGKWKKVAISVTGVQ